MRSIDKEKRRAIGKRIRQIRRKVDMSQSVLADHLGEVSTSAVSAYEKGMILPKPIYMERIAALGKIEVADLLDGGEVFEKVIGIDASDFEDIRPRIRSSESRFPHHTADIDRFIDNINKFKVFLENTADRLMQTKEHKSTGSYYLSDDERRLLVAFKRLPPPRRKRVIEDTEEWAATYPQTQDYSNYLSFIQGNK